MATSPVLNSQTTGTAAVPTKPTTLKLIKRQNEDCNTGDWTIKKNGSRQRKRQGSLDQHWTRIQEPPPEEASRTPNPNRSAWWTPKLGQIRKETRRLYIRAREGNFQGEWDAYHLGFSILA
ncbi:hypothetical protein ACLKA6_019950 [Drosophila palustris]